jgi:hypothetical protein
MYCAVRLARDFTHVGYDAQMGLTAEQEDFTGQRLPNTRIARNFGTSELTINLTLPLAIALSDRQQEATVLVVGAKWQRCFKPSRNTLQKAFEPGGE